VFEVSRGCGNPFLDMLRLRRSVVRLGFRSSQEALGWYVYVAACASIMSDKDPDFNKVRRLHAADPARCTAAHACSSWCGAADPAHLKAPNTLSGVY
jgi:hypothetical protein